MDIWSNLALRRPALCPEVALALVERFSPLDLAIRSEGLWAVHEVFPALAAPPYWAFAWASGLALARHLLDHPALVAGRSVADVGCGSGLAAIAAALVGAARVRAIDCDPIAVEAARRNALANGVAIDVELVDAADVKAAAGELVLAADLFYEEGSAAAALERWAAAGAEILFADPARGLLSAELGVAVARLEARTEPDFETTGPITIRRLVRM